MRSATAAQGPSPARLTARPACLLCAKEGEPACGDRPDQLFGVPGRWHFRRCRNDDLWWLDPRPVDDDLALTYPAAYLTHEGHTLRSSALWRGVRQAVLAAAFGHPAGRRSAALGRILAALPYLRERAGAEVMWLPGRPHGRLLDVGTGEGQLLALMRRAGWDVLGIDPDPASARAAGERLGVPVRVGTLDDIELAPESFDAVTLSHVIEHVPDPLRTLGQAWRLVRPGGRLVVLTPNAASLGRSVFGCDWVFLDPPRHLHLFSPRSLAACARRAGIDGVVVRTPIRSAALMAAWSLTIRAEPEARSIYAAPVTKLRRIAGWGFLLAEMTVGRSRGEEVLLVARKPS